MQLALDQARKAYNIGEVPIGAIIVKDDVVIGSGYNLREKNGDALAHAELIAIKQACEAISGWRLTGCALYVTIEPCPMCAGAIIQSRIDKVVYGAMDPKAGAGGSILNLLQMNELNHQSHVIKGVLEEECSALMKSFFRELRAKK
ncbi:tRNA adenosine(34) deaminase TadA [Serpentinicella alkaliphila]|uniref:tRNA-specific adenosine deaminase n=1 Tax=Serpentinicella alkaliphila TaxID=1734049 RepID=A0A4R2TER0_9FIRM|nr:tRNA adenosine(34) deaminase TadA [Serpentinicella alkaliphila]QUH25384.1 nucleoside deaminase [Serpentinicella alkaliphila]TCQ01561.1 tRNA-adenosine deaminase [Serpentinicella alkaliphila]